MGVCPVDVDFAIEGCPLVLSKIVPHLVLLI